MGISVSSLRAECIIKIPVSVTSWKSNLRSWWKNTESGSKSKQWREIPGWQSLSLTSTCIIIILEYNLLTLIGRLLWGTWWFYRDKRRGFKRIKIRIVLSTNKTSLNVLLRFMGKFLQEDFFRNWSVLKMLEYTRKCCVLRTKFTKTALINKNILVKSNWWSIINAAFWMVELLLGYML